MIHNKTSMSITCEFLDENKLAVIPESLKYTIIRDINDSIIKEVDVPSESITSIYKIPISVDDNTIDADSEKRKVIIEWEYNNGENGDTVVYYYNIEQP